MRLLTVLTGRDQGVAAFTQALKYNAEHAELAAMARTAAGKLAAEGRLRDFLLLSSRITGRAGEDREFQELLAGALERSGRVRAASRAYLRLSATDCSFLPDAARCCITGGDTGRALMLFASWRPDACIHAEHRRRLYMEAQGLRRLDIAMRMAEAWLDSEPSSTGALGALEDAKRMFSEAGRTTAAAAEKSAAEAYSMGEWEAVARMLEGTDARFLSRSGLAMLADAMERMRGTSAI